MSTKKKAAELPEGATQNADGSVTVALRRPIPLEGNTVAELTLREPEGDDMLTLDADFGVEGMKAMIIRLAGLPSSSWKKLSGRDVARLIRVVTYFLDDAPAGGA